MTGSTMVDMLGLRLEDPAESSFTSDAKVKALNIAQKTVVNLINNAYLTELQTIESAVSVSSGVVDIPTSFSTASVSFSGGEGSGATATAVISKGYLVSVDVTAGGSGYTSAPTVSFSNIGSSGATATATLDGAVVSSITVTNPGDGSITMGEPIRNGVISIKDATNDRFCTMIEAFDVKRTENSLLSSSSNSIAYVFQNKIYVKPDSISSVDVWYLKEPSDITDGSGEPDLNEALHEVMLDFAEAQLWRMDAQSERAAAAYQSATNQINALNARYEGEAPEGIGTKGRR